MAKPIEVNIDATRLDGRGRCRVWEIEKKKWIWVFPIDAKEMIAMGICTVDKPEGVKEASEEGEESEEESEEEVEVIDFTAYPVAQLRKFAEQAGINPAGMSKDQLANELKEAGFQPSE